MRVKFKRRCINNLLWIMCMLYPGVSSVLMGYFKCVTIGDVRQPLSAWEGRLPKAVFWVPKRARYSPSGCGGLLG
jgi:hypothetical protein